VHFISALINGAVICHPKTAAHQSFDVFVRSIEDMVGNEGDQTTLLKEQKTVALEQLEAVAPFARDLRSICGRYRSLEDNPKSFVLACFDRFWKLYRDCEEKAFAKFEREMNPSRLALPMDQLFDFKAWVEDVGLVNEKIQIEEAARNLVKRQLLLILQKNSLWSFDDWYSTMNSNEWKKVPDQQDWCHVSPSDWSSVISSLLLASSDYHFYESFGQEKIVLERARFLSNDRLVMSKQDRQFTAADGCPSLEHSLDGGYEKGRFRPKYPQTFNCVVRFTVPEKLSNKAHWGHIAWRYCNLVRSLHEY